MPRRIVFFDLESPVKTKHISDIGAVDNSGAVFHNAVIPQFMAFLNGADFVCGHNIIQHDIPLLEANWGRSIGRRTIDTLYWSPLLFPKKPYHSLLKDDKIVTDEVNNPVNDSLKAKELFADELSAFRKLPADLKKIYYCLLNGREEFKGFFDYLQYEYYGTANDELIRRCFKGSICENAPLATWIENRPVELAYALAVIYTGDRMSITPRWVQMNYPEIDNVVRTLCNIPCKEGCPYCEQKLNIHRALKDIFGYDSFRTYGGEPLQERAVQAAVEGDSLLAIFPTGGGKSITFQLPALMAGQNSRGLTVVISPLQSLMKDQVDHLAELGIINAVTVNGLLSAIERKDALERVENGVANLLYISPEMLRSNTVERLLLSRNIVRFVIDEAHCFSSWGHDFRVDYLYIGPFLKRIQKLKRLESPIPVSCFTATAKQKVVTDICEYFEKNLGVTLKLFTSSADRENLHYTVLYKDSEEEKYTTLRNLIDAKNCPTIVYVSRVKTAMKVAEKLRSDGFSARAFHGQMDPQEKIENQEAFIQNEVQIMVATSAFGMGVDKKDVRLVVHYNISDSLENYIQEAGRAGRDPSIQAECYILFSNSDLDAHFLLQNQTKLSIGDIQNIWTGIKRMTQGRDHVTCSALELARSAGWDVDSVDFETRVRTAVSALEQAGYVERGKNAPRVYASSIQAADMTEIRVKLNSIKEFNDLDREKAAAIVSGLIGSKRKNEHYEVAENRVDYIADRMGLEKSEVIDLVNTMKVHDVLSDDLDMAVYIQQNDTENRILGIVKRFQALEEFLVKHIIAGGTEVNLKELNEKAEQEGVKSASGHETRVKDFRTILYFLASKKIIEKVENRSKNMVQVKFLMKPEDVQDQFSKRVDLCEYAVKRLLELAQNEKARESGVAYVPFSLIRLFKEYKDSSHFEYYRSEVSLGDLEDALLYLSKIRALTLEGGFLVLYNAMTIQRKELDNRIRYKLDDYRMLDEFYKQKIQQIHIVGEYANLMVRDYDAALTFVHDYFNMDYKKFISTYFKGERERQINRNITPEKYEELFGGLSERQLEIINDAESQYIVVAAGPGSGKTKLLVHKLASLLLMEDVKHEQMLMLTFSRAAATEFKSRLIDLIGGAAYFVEIKTFHSYCFDLMGRIGSLEQSNDVVAQTVNLINNGEIEQEKITKSVLVVDEAQDMDQNEFALIHALMSVNPDMRVIAVGDDDQNIYEFRGSDSKYMRFFVQESGAKYYEMTDNYRSKRSIVAFANQFAKSMKNRLKRQDISAVSSENGSVSLIRCSSEFFEQAVVQAVCEIPKRQSVCVLTNTNDEAARITGLLVKKGVRAKLIQSGDSFRLYDLQEVRTFLQLIERYSKAPVIAEEEWNHAIASLKKIEGTSNCLENVLNLLSLFAQVNRKNKYKTDLIEYILESNFDDFYTEDNSVVFVSTIHKSKGREFDTVFLFLNGVVLNRGEDYRKLYVGMTRAKSDLRIYHNMDFFNRLGAYASFFDNRTYPEPKSIVVPFTHRDVVLDYFKNKKDQVNTLRSGDALVFDGTFFYQAGNPRAVAKISQKKRNEIEILANKGYIPTNSRVRFIAAWHGEGDEQECAVMLPDVEFEKKNV